MDISNYIEPELFIIVPVLYVLGAMIKKSSISDKWIPLILGVMGIALATAYKLAYHTPDGLNDVLKLIFAGVTQGILCAAGSVYANNVIKQMKKKDTDESNDQSDNSADN